MHVLKWLRISIFFLIVNLNVFIKKNIINIQFVKNVRRLIKLDLLMQSLVIVYLKYSDY